MNLSACTVQQLKELANAGGGFHLHRGSKTVQELKEIASAARAGGARFTLSGFGAMTFQEMKEIAGAGGGAVFFTD